MCAGTGEFKPPRPEDLGSYGQAFFRGFVRMNLLLQSIMGRCGTQRG